MNFDKEKVGRILVEKGEGGCWHDFAFDKKGYGCHCKKCGITWYGNHELPDFSEWQHFGRLLKIAGERRIGFKFYPNGSPSEIKYMAILDRTVSKWWDIAKFDQIPMLVATELARIIEEGK